MSFYAPSLSVLWRHIEAYGLDASKVFAAEGISRSELSDNSKRLPFEVVDRLRAEAAKLSGDPLFGLKYAKFWHPSFMGAFGYAWLLSPTLVNAFEICSRYIRMVNSGLELRLSESPDQITVEIITLRESLIPQLREDGLAAMLVMMCRANYGISLNPESVDLCHQDPVDASAYYAFFKCPVNFGARALQVSFNRTQAEKVCLNANEQLRQMNLEIIRQYLLDVDKQDIVSRVRHEITQQLPGGQVTDASVANKFHMTSRTLQRRLKAEGCTFKQLLTAVRTELANEYIRDKSLSLTEVSFLLGFAETSSFSRAYKRWMGHSPSQAASS